MIYVYSRNHCYKQSQAHNLCSLKFLPVSWVSPHTQTSEDCITFKVFYIVKGTTHAKKKSVRWKKICAEDSYYPKCLRFKGRMKIKIKSLHPFLLPVQTWYMNSLWLIPHFYLVPDTQGQTDFSLCTSLSRFYYVTVAFEFIYKHIEITLISLCLCVAINRSSFEFTG